MYPGYVTPLMIGVHWRSSSAVFTKLTATVKLLLVMQRGKQWYFGIIEKLVLSSDTSMSFGGPLNFSENWSVTRKPLLAMQKQQKRSLGTNHAFFSSDKLWSRSSKSMGFFFSEIVGIPSEPQFFYPRTWSEWLKTTRKLCGSTMGVVDRHGPLHK